MCRICVARIRQCCKLQWIRNDIAVTQFKLLKLFNIKQISRSISVPQGRLKSFKIVFQLHLNPFCLFVDISIPVFPVIMQFAIKILPINQRSSNMHNFFQRRKYERRWIFSNYFSKISWHMKPFEIQERKKKLNTIFMQQNIILKLLEAKRPAEKKAIIKCKSKVNKDFGVQCLVFFSCCQVLMAKPLTQKATTTRTARKTILDLNLKMAQRKQLKQDQPLAICVVALNEITKTFLIFKTIGF